MDRLERFLDGQRFGYETALKEMRNGRKVNHWIWYIFPQINGLGHSPNAQFYGILSLDEAKAYLEHQVLGQRLREITIAVLSHKGEDIYEIMGSRIDAINKEVYNHPTILSFPSSSYAKTELLNCHLLDSQICNASRRLPCCGSDTCTSPLPCRNTYFCILISMRFRYLVFPPQHTPHRPPTNNTIPAKPQRLR